MTGEEGAMKPLGGSEVRISRVGSKIVGLGEAGTVA